MSMDTRPLPTLFISHGAPDLILSDHVALDAQRTIAARLPKPRTIVIVSAHWMDEPVGITDAGPLATLYDFTGFPDALYSVHYPASGDATLSKQVERHLNHHGITTRRHAQRGLDHGAWLPLMIMYPQADIPIVQIALPRGSLDALTELGHALAPLREQDTLIIGSGGSTHNLRALKLHGGPDAWAEEFEHWLYETVEGNHFERLLSFAELPPTVVKHAHPTLEHYAPLIVAWAAGNPARPGRRIHHSFSYGNLGMSCFEFA